MKPRRLLRTPGLLGVAALGVLSLLGAIYWCSGHLNSDSSRGLSGDQRPAATISGDATPNAPVLPEPEDAAVSSAKVVSLAAGEKFTCALGARGAVRCWGRGAAGNLGYGNTQNWGDQRLPIEAGDVPLGGKVKKLSAGYEHVCAVLESGSVRCWGKNRFGQLGYGHTNSIGDDETPATAGDVDVGGPVLAIAAGSGHSCAVLVGGGLRCWGFGGNGELGYGNRHNIGDDELPASAGDVRLGAPALRVAASEHTCVLLKRGSIRCFGAGFAGELGYGHVGRLGDDIVPASLGDINVGGVALSVATGRTHSCALLDGGRVRCWGSAKNGRLGYGDMDDIGDDEPPALAGDVPLGGAAAQISLGRDHSCALLTNGKVRCWGLGEAGRLGYGNVQSVGDDEPAASAGDIALGAAAIQISAGGDHTCALLEDGHVRCFGAGAYGQLGYGNTLNIGDDELPQSVGYVSVF